VRRECGISCAGGPEVTRPFTQKHIHNNDRKEKEEDYLFKRQVLKGRIMRTMDMDMDLVEWWLDD
jgi:hypothetical protein